MYFSKNISPRTHKSPQHQYLPCLIHNSTKFHLTTTIHVFSPARDALQCGCVWRNQRLYNGGVWSPFWTPWPGTHRCVFAWCLLVDSECVAYIHLSLKSAHQTPYICLTQHPIVVWIIHTFLWSVDPPLWTWLKKKKSTAFQWLPWNLVNVFILLSRWIIITSLILVTFHLAQSSKSKC